MNIVSFITSLFILAFIGTAIFCYIRCYQYDKHNRQIKRQRNRRHKRCEKLRIKRRDEYVSGEEKGDTFVTINGVIDWNEGGELANMN